jgi:acyl-CoA reductase-like NAD-dependent aldehyde dehydrogenase
MDRLAALVGQQQQFFHSGATRPFEFRREQLQRLHDALEAHEAELIWALHADLPRPACRQTDAYDAALVRQRLASRHFTNPIMNGASGGVAGTGQRGVR